MIIIVIIVVIISTIGPITATLSGILTVDCGSPQFSMHSIRYDKLIYFY